MLNIKDSRFIVTYSKCGKEVSFSKQFNSKFHLDNYVFRMRNEGYQDIKVSEKGNILGIFSISFTKEGKEKKITKRFVSKRAKDCYVEALKRDKCKNIVCTAEIKSISSKDNGTFKYIPARDSDQTFYYNRTNKKSNF